VLQYIWDWHTLIVSHTVVVKFLIIIVYFKALPHFPSYLLLYIEEGLLRVLLSSFARTQSLEILGRGVACLVPLLTTASYMSVQCGGELGRVVKNVGERKQKFHRIWLTPPLRGVIYNVGVPQENFMSLYT
jgi:hypothetical protein